MLLASHGGGLSYFSAQLPHPDDGCAVVTTRRGIKLADVNVLDMTLDDGPHAPILAVTPALYL